MFLSYVVLIITRCDEVATWSREALVFFFPPVSFLKKSQSGVFTRCDEVASGLRMPSIRHNQCSPFFFVPFLPIFNFSSFRFLVLIFWPISFFHFVGSTQSYFLTTFWQLLYNFLATFWHIFNLSLTTFYYYFFHFMSNFDFLFFSSVLRAFFENEECLIHFNLL
jgi:hypothetical protein